jgi:opacity protein-like surface antigen
MRRTLAAALIAVSLVPGSAALAQGATAAPRPLTLGASAGLTLPTGDFGDVTKTGFNVGAHLAFRPATLPFGVRVEGQFNRFAIEDNELIGFEADGNIQIISGTANVVLGVPTDISAIRPYVIGGVGIYNYRSSGRFTLGGETESGTASQTDFGLNGGAGVEFGLGGLAAFVEARYHVIFNAPDDDELEGIENTKFIPISFGIKF